MRLQRALCVLAVTLVTLGVLATSATAAVTISRADLSGTQLRVEGSGVLANHTVTITPGSVTTTSDGSGAFRVQTSPYSSPTCQVTVSDGVSSASARLSGCTPTQSPPPPPPPPPPPASAPVTFTPSSLTFGAQDIGSTSAAQSVAVANTGSAPLFINSAATRGADPLDFTEVNDGCSGLTLAVGTSCSVSINFSPTASGTRSATLIVTDNAAGSPQTAPITGTGVGTNPPLTINTQFMTCSGGVCDIGAGSNVFVNNFFTTTFLASGGTAPYTWSGQPPAGLTLRPSGLLLGAPTTTGASTFTVTVTDGAGAKATGTFSLTVTGPPAPTPPGCQTGGILNEALSGSASNGRTPSGRATSDESQFSGCGGFSILSVQVSNVSLPDGTVLWVTLDFKAVGTITVRGGSGTMARYNMGDFGVSRDQIRVNSALPDLGTSQQILIGGSFIR